MKNGCPCSPEPGITLLTVAGGQVGLNAVDALFSRWRAGQRQPADLSDEEILNGVRKHNYISRNVEQKIAGAIRSLYARFCANEGK